MVISTDITQKKTMKQNIGNSGPGMGQAQTCGGVKLVNGTKRKLTNYLIVEGRF